MGVAGAAVATVIGQVFACIFALVLNLKKNPEIHLVFRGFRPNWSIIGSIYAIGLPSVVMMAIGSVMTFLMNKILITYHSARETAATAFGIYFKLNSFVFMPVFGLNNGVIPIIAFNYGAQQRRRMIETIKRSTVYASCVMVLGMVIFQLLPGTLLKIFKATDTMMSVGIRGLHRPGGLLPGSGQVYVFADRVLHPPAGAADPRGFRPGADRPQHGQRQPGLVVLSYRGGVLPGRDPAVLPAPVPHPDLQAARKRSGNPGLTLYPVKAPRSVCRPQAAKTEGFFDRQEKDRSRWSGPFPV